MKYKKLIKESAAISEIGLGAWQLGTQSGWRNLTEIEASEIVHHAINLGINFFDTAPNYGLGSSEIRLGKALKNFPRESVVINTKFGHTDLGTTNYDARDIRRSLEGSLKRLQTDYVDSLIMHNPPKEFLDGNKNEHYTILEELKKEGKIKAYGASLDSFDEIKLLLQTTQSKIIEVFFNIFHQDTARAFDLAKEKEVGVIVKIPLDSGWLTGKYNEQSTFKGVRQRWTEFDIKTRAGLVDQIKKIIGNEVSITQQAIAFCLAFDAVSTVIPGSLSIEQLESNLKASTCPMPQHKVKQLEDFYYREIKHLKLPW